MTWFTEQPRTVYFARPCGQRGPIKIGATGNLRRRHEQLQIAEQCQLEIVAAFTGSLDIERHLQSLFWHDRIRGEWFSWSTGLQLVIDAVRRGEFDVASLPPAKVRKMPGRRPWTDEQRARARLSHARRLGRAA